MNINRRGVLAGFIVGVALSLHLVYGAVLGAVFGRLGQVVEAG